MTNPTADATWDQLGELVDRLTQAGFCDIATMVLDAADDMPTPPGSGAPIASVARGPWHPGRTYHGAMTTTEAIWRNGKGEPCEPADAVWGEITVYDDEGVPLERTYMESTTPADYPRDEPISIENQDLLKRGTWDIWAVDDGIWTLAETLPQLFQALDLTALPTQERRERVGRFIALPAWDPAPEALKRETYAWLEATRA